MALSGARQSGRKMGIIVIKTSLRLRRNPACGEDLMTGGLNE